MSCFIFHLILFICFNTNEIVFIYVDVSDVATNGLNYWCEWPLQKRQFVNSAECKKKWPRVVQTFLESKLQEVNEANVIGGGVGNYEIQY